MMFDGQKALFLATRTCTDFAFTLVDGGVIMLLLRIRVSLLTALKIEQMEPPQIFHYALGQEIKPHYDGLYDQLHPYGPEGTYQGDRLATFLMYLNDDYDGGDLEFVKVGYSYKGKAGDGIFFASMREGKPDSQSLHGARPGDQRRKVHPLAVDPRPAVQGLMGAWESANEISGPDEGSAAFSRKRHLSPIQNCCAMTLTGCA